MFFFIEIALAAAFGVFVVPIIARWILRKLIIWTELNPQKRELYCKEWGMR